jgi:hypothetical protein
MECKDMNAIKRGCDSSSHTSKSDQILCVLQESSFQVMYHPMCSSSISSVLCLHVLSTTG